MHATTGGAGAGAPGIGSNAIGNFPQTAWEPRCGMHENAPPPEGDGRGSCPDRWWQRVANMNPPVPYKAVSGGWHAFERKEENKRLPRVWQCLIIAPQWRARQHRQQTAARCDERHRRSVPSAFVDKVRKRLRASPCSPSNRVSVLSSTWSAGR